MPGFCFTAPAAQHRDEAESGEKGTVSSSNPSLVTDELCSIGKVS